MAVRTPADAPLRRDVRLLGDLLGRVLVEQEDESLLADVEHVRALARAARQGDARDELRDAVEALPLERQASVLRAFALYFQLANVAEQHHRIRRLRRVRARGARAGASRSPTSFAAARRRAAGGASVSLQLVLTAHPTEAARRTVLAAHLRIAALLARARRPRSQRRARDRGALAAEITMLWQADEVRSRRPRVVDEIRNGHWFFEQSLIDAAERLLADYRRHLPDAPPPLRFGSVDRRRRRRQSADAGAETITEALERARTLLLPALPGRGARARRRDRRLVAAHAGRPTSCSSRSRATSASCAEYAAEIGDQNLDEPYRRKLIVHVAAARRGRVRVRRRLRRGSRHRRPQPAREPRRTHRRRRARGAAPPRRALRLPSREARRARARARPRRSDERMRGSSAVADAARGTGRRRSTR